MANGKRSIVVALRAVVSDYVAKFRQAKVGTDELSTAQKKQAEQQKQAWESSKQSLGSTASLMLKAGTAGAAGLVMMTKAAIDWESVWAGVTKTVDGTEAELSQLETSLRQMAKSMPATHSEIAAVAEAAGQLGVATKDVAGFTRVMIDLGETTNLTADEASTSLAQLMNVMGTAPDQVDRLGAAIVDLGNKGASTERDIVQMAQRIAAAGKSVGMGETDVLAYASALASVGVEAEAGGTAISQSFKDIDRAVRAGGQSLKLIATTAGMTADDFAAAWRDDAAGAARAFIEGLGRMQTAGQDANGVLDKLGMTGMRQSDSLMRLAQAGNLLADNLTNSGRAWDENTALAVEAGKRYETTASKIQIAMNNIQDAAITMGSEVLPIVADLADRAGDLASFFGGLPGPVKAAGMQMMLVGTAGLLAAGGLLKASVAAADFQAKSSLIAASPLASRLTAIGKAAGVATLALVAAQAAGAAAQSAWDDQTATVGEYTIGLIKLARSTGSLDDIPAKVGRIGGGMKDFGEVVNQIAYASKNGFADAGNATLNWLIGMKGATAAATDEMHKLDEALAQLPAEQAAQAFAKIAPQMQAAGLGADKILDLFPKLTEQYRQQQIDLGVLNLSQEQYVDWMAGRVPPAIAAAEAAERSRTGTTAGAIKTQQEMAEATQAATKAALEQAAAMNSVLGGQIGFEEAIANTAKAIRKNGESTDLTTKKGRDNLAMLRSLSGATLSFVADLNEQGASQQEVSAVMSRGREKFIEAAEAAGYHGKALQDLADKAGLIPPEKGVKVKTGIDKKGINAWESYRPSTKTATIKPHVLPSSAQIKIDGATYSLKVTGGRAATGGLIGGVSPTPTADDKIVAVTSGEFVHQVAAVNYYGAEVMNAMNTRRIPREVVQGFAGGGLVGGQPGGAGSPAGTVGTQINVANHYPQAEPTSVTINRAQQYAAALGRH